MKCSGAHVAEAVDWCESGESRVVDRALVAKRLGGAGRGSYYSRDLFKRLRRTSAGKCAGMLSSVMGAVPLAFRLARRKKPYEASELMGMVSLN